MENIQERLNGFVEMLSQLTGQSISIQAGRKYYKILQRGGDSVYCFVDPDGRIMKAASWKSPVPHGYRGSIFAEDFGKSACGKFGLNYLR